MANKGVKGQIVDAVSGAGIADLTVKAVDFDPFFNEDDILATGKTGSDGKFQLTYDVDAYSFWKFDRNPDIVVQIYGPVGRLLHETKEVENVTDTILTVPAIKIHPDAIHGWLVTHTTLNPENGEPVALFKGNEIQHLVDGDIMFPAVTQAAKDAKSSINLMTLFFAVSSGLITQFKSDFDPSNPPSANCKNEIEATLEEELKKKGTMPVNVMVTDLPLSAEDTVAEVRKFFENSQVKTSDYSKGLSLLHTKAIIVDGTGAILMGSPLKQTYFSDERHAIHDARHKGSLIHDVSIRVDGPAVTHIDKTFATIWKATGKSLVTITPDQIAERTGANIASVQVLRTLPGDTFKAKNPGDEDLPFGETGILEAYQRAFANAEHFIYIENQYFTSPEIVDALIARMKDTTKPKLHIILVLNIRPDLPGYPDQQVNLVNQLKISAKANGHKFGVYSLWSRAEKAGSASNGKKQFEIMPVYVHSKTTIIDDTWATVGSANLDGTSMNYHQIGLMVTSIIADKLLDRIKLDNNFGKFLWDSFWFLLFYVFKEYLFNLKAVLIILFIIYKVITDFKEIIEALTEITDIPDIMRDVFARTAQHALPNRSRQPSRNVEMNVVLYSGIASQPATPVINQLRDRLWREHLGLESLPADMQNVPANQADMKWVDFWDARAKANSEAFKKEESLPGDHAPQILEWQSETEAEEYLRSLKIRTKNLRDSADKFDFDKCKLDTHKKLLPWPII